MTTVRSMEKLLCTDCNEVMVHLAGRCTHCGAANNRSGAKPIPRARPYGYATMRAENYSARAEQASARRRARIARHQVLARGHT